MKTRAIDIYLYVMTLYSPFHSEDNLVIPKSAWQYCLGCIALASQLKKIESECIVTLFSIANAMNTYCSIDVGR